MKKLLLMINRKHYYTSGQRRLMARLHPRRQLEQWHECWGIHVESEQYADEYQHQHWLSGRQELQVPPEVGFTDFWPQEWRLTTVAASVHDDLPFVLSGPVSFIARWPNMTAGSEHLLYGGLSLPALGIRSGG